jgi:putative transposase
MSASMTSALVIDALTMALWRRGKPTELLHHSDQGSQPRLNWSSQHRYGLPSVAVHDCGGRVRRE